MLKKILVCCLSVGLGHATLGQSAPITIDGLFDDWGEELATYTDSEESVSGINLIEFQVTNDEDHLFIRIKANEEFDLTENYLIEHEIGLFIDSDNNTSTGFPSQAGYGTELGLLFFDLFAHYNVPEYSQVGLNDLQMQVAPTVTSDEFEIAIRRDVIPDGQYPLFTSSTIKILLKNDLNTDAMPNDGEVFTYEFDDTQVAPYTPIDIDKDDENHIRFVAYNTLFNGLEDADRIEYFERIIKAIDPDVMGFVESGVSNLSNIKAMFDSWLETDDPNGWYTEINGGELIVSRWPIIHRWDDLERQFPVLIDLPEEYELDVIYTNAHLSCCSSEELRQNQADQYARFVIDVKTDREVPTNTPFIYSGDLNLVGLARPLRTLLEGEIINTSIYGIGEPLDWDGSDFAELNALHTESRFNYTWRSDNSPFPPGKLDFFIYSDFTLNLEKSYVLFTEDMPSSTLSDFGLQSGDSFGASDHLPVVADFTIKSGLKVLNASEIDKDGMVETYYPNPVENDFMLAFKSTGTYLIRVYSTSGKEMMNFKVFGSMSVLTTTNLKSGMYLLEVTNSEGQNESFTFVKK